MQWRDVSQNWAAYIPRILTEWPDLDEDEVQSIDGDQDAFIAYLSKSKGEDRVAAQMALADWLMGGEPIDVSMAAQNDNANIMASAADVPAGEDVSDDDAKFGDDNVAAEPVGRAS
ncbi:hypothetical protein SAMN04488003_10112 [Loktanella fryxellensis]|uniref:Uncharacterized protein n=1 Tax=Loktanella fryxellensis TaxID=245187 RepID=A0A1H7Y7Q6_9RHOB|nr:hypothetical protein [Loktanella fryxellensis]SEM41367.1 hypothetical protein SAMN04488003_10112 [Loktanella fryxellensis]